MKISNINMKKVENEGKVKAYVSFVLNDNFAVHNVRIIDGAKGLFVAMPSHKVGNEYKDLCHPITQELRNEISTFILGEYLK
jgi:stage V sporulation protein G